MVNAPTPRTLVVNFNSPELNQLALALVNVEALAAYVRPYANKSRLWERALSELPLLGDAYSATFGRRRLDDPRLASLTHEAGVLADLTGNYRLGFTVLALVAGSGSVLFMMAKKPEHL